MKISRLRTLPMRKNTIYLEGKHNWKLIHSKELLFINKYMLIVYAEYPNAWEQWMREGDRYMLSQHRRNTK